MEYVVPVLPVFDTMVPHVVPPSVDLSILYPVMAEPPLLEGAVQERSICDEDSAVATSPVGEPGGVAAGADVVADAVLDGELVNTRVIAKTR